MPVIDHKYLIKPSDEQVIWRYMDIHKFESLVRERSLFFCRADNFADRFEGSIPRAEAEGIKDSELIAELIGEDLDLLPGQHLWEPSRFARARSIRSFVVNCWHINELESYAMWDLYLKDRVGVAVRSKVKRLRECFSLYDGTLLITQVRYIDYDNGYWFDEIEYPYEPQDRLKVSVFAPITHKRSAFAHERELRVLQHFEGAINNRTFWTSGQTGIPVPCDLELLVERVILPPDSDENVRKRVMEIINKYGAKLTVEASKLDEEPYY